ncbi:hypothetical protein PAAL109150_01080 [Paenibacillus alkaliterrae]
MEPVFVKAPPTYPDMIQCTSSCCEYSVGYAWLLFCDWVFVTEIYHHCH